MTLPADIAAIESRHTRDIERLWTDRGEDVGIGAHTDRAALLRAYRELAEENERLTLERDEARGIKLAQLKAVVGERDRLRASHAKVFEAGWRTAATWAVRADLIFDIGSPAYLEDEAKALADAQHPADACQHDRLKCEPDESRIYCADCGAYVRHTP